MQRSTLWSRAAASAASFAVVVACLLAPGAHAEPPPAPGAAPPAPPAPPSPARGAAPIDPVRPSLDQNPVFSIDSPIGPIEYRAGRGMHFGRTGLNIGGFTTFEFERERGGESELALDSINFLILLQPIEQLRFFAELELDGIFEWTKGEGVESDANLNAERLFVDLTLEDAFNVRFGKFLTPIGRWNLVPAEPFTWTPIEPVVVETAFDEHTTGGALKGSFYPGGSTLSYWIYGQFMDPLDPSNDPEPADRSVGGRLEFDEPFGSWSVGSSFLATEISGDWSYLGGIDAEWHYGPLELVTEATITRGNIPDRDIYDFYLQAVFELVPTLYAVGRYEHFNRVHEPGVNLGDLGLTWIPRPYLRLKAIYRLSGRQTDDVSDGVKVSFSVVF